MKSYGVKFVGIKDRAHIYRKDELGCPSWWLIFYWMTHIKVDYTIFEETSFEANGNGEYSGQKPNQISHFLWFRRDVEKMWYHGPL